MNLSQKLKAPLLYAAVAASSMFLPHSEVYSQSRPNRTRFQDTKKYHPQIEEFEKRLEKEISQLIPTYYEMKMAYSYKNLQLNPPFLKKAIKIQNNPKIIQDNPHYKEFIKESKEVYKIPSKKGFLDNYFQRIAYMLNNETLMEFIKEANSEYNKVGLKFNLAKPREAEEALMFLYWIRDRKEWEIKAPERGKMMEGKHPFANSPGYSQKAFEVSETKTRGLMNKILDNLNKTENFPVTNFKSSRYVKKYPLELAQFRADYSEFLENIVDEDIIPIIGGKWIDKNENGISEISELEDLYNPIFLNGSVMNFGVYSLKEKEILTNINIKLFDSNGEEMISSNGFGYVLKKSDEKDFGVYTAAFIAGKKVWQVRQFRLVPDNNLGIYFRDVGKLIPLKILDFKLAPPPPVMIKEEAPAPPIASKGPFNEEKAPAPPSPFRTQSTFY